MIGKNLPNVQNVKPRSNSKTKDKLNSSNQHINNSQIDKSKNSNVMNNSKLYEVPEIETLRLKVRDQAQRLTNLETYKILCEERIKQLAPEHPLPITNIHLTKQFKLPTNTAKKSNLDFNSLNLDKLPVDKVKEAYSKLLENFHALQDEREAIIQSLREETLLNEEQRNYIEILRQTLESQLIKNGLSTLKLDYVIDLAIIKDECERYRKELIMSKLIIDEMKSDIEILNKTNEELESHNYKSSDIIEERTKELNNALVRIENLEKNRAELEKDRNEAVREHRRLNEDTKILKTTLNKAESSLNETTKKNLDLGKALENQYVVQNKLNEYQKSFEQLYEDYERVVKERDDADRENKEYQEEIKNYTSDLRQLKQKFDFLEEEKKNIIRENEELNQNLKKVEKLFNEECEKSNEKEIENQRFINKQIDLEKQLNSVIDNFNNLQEKNNRDIIILKDKNEEFDLTKNRLEEANKTITNIKEEKSSLEVKLKHLKEDLDCSRSGQRKLDEELSNLNTDLNETLRERERLKDLLEQMNLELKENKLDFEREIKLKISEVNELKSILDENNLLIENLNNKIEKSQKDNTNLDNELRRRENENMKLNNALNDVLKKNERLTSELTKESNITNELNYTTKNLLEKNEDLEKEIQNLNEDKENANLKIKRLSGDIESLKKNEKDLQIKTNTFSKELSDYKTSYNNISNIITKNLNKVNSIIKNRTDNSSIVSSSYWELVRSLNSENKLPIRAIEDYIRLTGNEMICLFDIIFEDNRKLQENSEKLKSVIAQVRQFELQEEEKGAQQRRLETNLSTISNNFNTMQSDYLNLEKQNEKLTRALKNMKTEYKTLSENYEDIKSRLKIGENDNEKFLQEIREREHLLNNASFQVSALEERIIILIKEKKYLEALVVRVSKSFPEKSMQKIVNQIMDLSDELASLERDRLKLEDSLIDCEEKSMSLHEQERLKNVTVEYDKKINEKRNVIRTLENEMRSIETSEKSKTEKIYDLESRNKMLEKDLNLIKDDLKKLKMKNFAEEEEMNVYKREKIVKENDKRDRVNFDSLQFSDYEEGDWNIVSNGKNQNYSTGKYIFKKFSDFKS